jgi:hypothetical protein
MSLFGAQTARRALPAAALLLLTGCGGPGTVTGKVTYKGGPLPGGLVTVVDAIDNRYPGQIQRDGTYTVANVPPGPAKIVVGTTSEIGSIMHPGERKEPYGPYVRIPKRYGQPDKSGMALYVKTGKQEYMIDLKDDFEPGELQQKQ